MGGRMFLLVLSVLLVTSFCQQDQPFYVQQFVPILNPVIIPLISSKKTDIPSRYTATPKNVNATKNSGNIFTETLDNVSYKIVFKSNELKLKDIIVKATPRNVYIMSKGKDKFFKKFFLPSNIHLCKTITKYNKGTLTIEAPVLEEPYTLQIEEF
jgi:HSP20 family molecular chaperone IbpA